MSIRVVIESQTDKVYTFTTFLQQLCQYRVYHKAKSEDTSGEMRYEYYLDERTPLPLSLKQEVKTIHLIDYSGQKIEITLLGCESVEMQDGTTIIYGRNYDILQGEYKIRTFFESRRYEHPNFKL